MPPIAKLFGAPQTAWFNNTYSQMGLKEDLAEAVPSGDDRQSLRDRIGYDPIRSAYDGKQMTELHPKEAFKIWTSEKLKQISEWKGRCVFSAALLLFLQMTTLLSPTSSMLGPCKHFSAEKILFCLSLSSLVDSMCLDGL